MARVRPTRPGSATATEPEGARETGVDPGAGRYPASKMAVTCAMSK